MEQNELSKTGRPYLINCINTHILSRLKPRTVDLLKTTSQPAHAYIVLEVPKRRVVGKGAPVMTTGICIINVEDQPAQKYNLDDLTKNRLGRIIGYGNFPQHNDANPQRSRKYQLYNEGEGVNPWDGIKQYCDHDIGQDEKIAHEFKRYEVELAAAKARIAELEVEENDGQKPKRSNRRNRTEDGTVLPGDGSAAKEVTRE